MIRLCVVTPFLGQLWANFCIIIILKWIENFLTKSKKWWNYTLIFLGQDRRHQLISGIRNWHHSYIASAHFFPYNFSSNQIMQLSEDCYESQNLLNNLIRLLCVQHNMFHILNWTCVWFDLNFYNKHHRHHFKQYKLHTDHFKSHKS